VGTRGNPVPLQFTAFRKEDFQSESGIAAFNLQLQQIVNALNEGNGSVSRVSLPYGVDVRGSTISNVGDPKNPTDAVSQGHVSTNYGAPTLRPQLDIGGKQTLKGLTYLYAQQPTTAAAIARLPTNNYSGSGSIDLFGAIIQFGLIANMDTAVFPMNFPSAFPTACQSIVCATTGPTDRITYVVSFSTSQFTLANNGTGAGATWIACGW